MPVLIQRYATPLITGLFLVSLVSGIALFFHLGQAYFHGMHEWLSMVLILPFVLHLWKNWRAMTTYFARPAFAAALSLSLAAGLWFAYQGATNTSGGPPQLALARMMLASPAAEVAPLLDMSQEELLEKLAASGFALGDGTGTLADMARASGKSDMDLAQFLVQSKQ
jgi:hypothetical protein